MNKWRQWLSKLPWRDVAKAYGTNAIGDGLILLGVMIGNKWIGIPLIVVGVVLNGVAFVLGIRIWRNIKKK